MRLIRFIKDYTSIFTGIVLIYGLFLKSPMAPKPIDLQPENPIAVVSLKKFIAQLQEKNIKSFSIQPIRVTYKIRQEEVDRDEIFLVFIRQLYYPAPSLQRKPRILRSTTDPDFEKLKDNMELQQAKKNLGYIDKDQDLPSIGYVVENINPFPISYFRSECRDFLWHVMRCSPGSFHLTAFAVLEPDYFYKEFEQIKDSQEKTKLYLNNG